MPLAVSTNNSIFPSRADLLVGYAKTNATHQQGRKSKVEDKEVAVRLYNAVGGLIAKESVQFKNGIANFKVQNVSSGLYMICLTEGQNKPICLKFNIH